MDKRNALKHAKQFAKVVNSKFDTIKVILFGSYAKGNFHEDSDIDIAVILKDFSNTFSMRLELMQLRRGIDTRIEPHPFTEADFEISNPLVYEIMKHGKELKVK